MQSLIITEIYSSVQGESTFTGIPCAFIRLTGCPLRCKWCDTVYGFHGGASQTIEEILNKVKELDISLVELTGGEPLAQANAIPLMDELIAAGYQVLIETGGSEPIEQINPKVHIIMDIKCPGSGMVDRNRYENLQFLSMKDEIKFVIADRKDFEWARDFIQQHQLVGKAKLLFSPAWGLCKPDELVAWILADKVPVRLNLQTHKYIWNPKKKGV